MFKNIPALNNENASLKLRIEKHVEDMKIMKIQLNNIEKSVAVNIQRVLERKQHT